MHNSIGDLQNTLYLDIIINRSISNIFIFNGNIGIVILKLQRAKLLAIKLQQQKYVIVEFNVLPY